jgi:ribonucleoside-diphosphate reductase beta chain
MFKKPELRMMMGAFADMESTHIEAYSLLLETVGMPEAEYSIFQEFSEMKEKHEFYFSADIYENDISNLARKIAIFSAFGEGLQLFSSFAMLLNFQRFNKMKGMGQLITWSVRDESLHVEYMLKIFHEILVDYPHIWNDSFKNDLYEVGKKMVELEFNFIDLAFSNSKIEGMEASEVKDYVCQTADRRFIQLGLQPVYGIKTDPLPWLRSILHAVEHANFFETRATEYSRDTMTGSFEDVWGKFSKLEEPVA